MARLAYVIVFVIAGILAASACSNINPQYEGEYVDGQRHGYGKMIWPEPEAKIYEGEWVDGKAHGHGTYLTANGIHYEGDWADGMQHGNGSALWADSLNRYVGEWAKGQQHGHGTAIWANGTYYEGQWVRGKPHGHGTGIWMSTFKSNGGCCYQRSWVNQTNDKLSTHNFEAWSMGGRYEGNFAHGAREGHGTMEWSNGERYEGDWVRGGPQGRGIFLTASGDRYEGEFSNSSVTTDDGSYHSFYDLGVVFPHIPSLQDPNQPLQDPNQPCWKYENWLEPKENNYPINELPMFGLRSKTTEQKRADEELIEYMTRDGKSKEQAAESFARLGWYSYKGENYSTAIKRFNQAWLLDPGNHLALWGFAVISFERDQIEESIRYFRMAIESAPENQNLKKQTARAISCWNNIPRDIYRNSQ